MSCSRLWVKLLCEGGKGGGWPRHWHLLARIPPSCPPPQAGGGPWRAAVVPPARACGPRTNKFLKAPPRRALFERRAGLPAPGWQTRALADSPRSRRWSPCCAGSPSFAAPAAARARPSRVLAAPRSPPPRRVGPGSASPPPTPRPRPPPTQNASMRHASPRKLLEAPHDASNKEIVEKMHEVQAPSSHRPVLGDVQNCTHAFVPSRRGGSW